MSKPQTLVLIIALFFLVAGTGYAEPTANEELLEESIKNQLDALGLEEVTRYVELVDEDYRQFLPGLELRDILGGGEGVNVGELFRSLMAYLFSEVVVSSHLLRQLLVISVLSALLGQLQTSFGSKSVVDLSFAVCFLILLFVGLQSFRTAVSIATQSIDEMVSFMHALLPMMATLLAAVGGISSAALFHPVLIAVVSSIASLVRLLLFPIISLSAVLGLLAHFSDDFPISRLASLARQASIFVLSSFFVIFSGVMVVRGAIAPVADGLTLRTAKFLTKTFVPVIGGMFADAAEVVIGGSLLIKNGVGIFGLVLIFFLAALPVIKLWAIIFIYKLVGALIQPICDSRIVNALSSLESSLTLIMVALATVALMFFLCITILIGFGNLAVVMR